jgi:hypothetical protein
MDRKKHRHFRGAHPKRYRIDTQSIASSSNVRSKSISHNPAHIRDHLDKRSEAGESCRSHLSTSQRLHAMSTRASGTGRLKTALKTAGKPKDLREIISENQVYEDVVSEINKKLALKEAIDRANGAI